MSSRAKRASKRNQMTEKQMTEKQMTGDLINQKPDIARDHNTEVNEPLIRFEEFALSLEEHFHAQQLFAKNPNNKPLGHR
jgi:hypothetical protein|tara:strand:- start:1520 stop:1759 length:240 start_codon:yes stop_codon:yes gene_type:complete